MATLVKMPQLGESVVEGTVVRWLKAPGDAVAKHEPLLEISTDKIDTEVPAPADGVLLEILVTEGMTVAAGTQLATIGAPGTAPAQIPTPGQPPQEGKPTATQPAERATGRADPHRSSGFGSGLHPDGAHLARRSARAIGGRF